MTIPSRPAPPPPNQQQQHQNNGGGSNTSSQLAIKLPPPPSQKINSKIYQSTRNLNKTSTLSSSLSAQSTIRKLSSTQNWVNDPFEMVTKNLEKKKIPPPRPPPPKKDCSNFNYSSETVLKKPGPPQSVSMLSNIFGKKKYNSTLNKSSILQGKQFPPNKFPPLSNSTTTTTKSVQQNYQSRPYAFVPPLVRNSNETELINFDSPPNSPILKKSNSDCISMGSFTSNSNINSPIIDSISQSESGFEDDFTSPTDPWEILTVNNFKDNNSQFKSQPVRNINVINNIKGDDLLSNGKNLISPHPSLTMPTIIKPKPSQSMNSNYIKKTTAPKPPTLVKEASVDSNLSDESPPMPNCPPPPPPQEIFDEDINNESSYGIALYDFEGLEDGDLPFRENEKIYLLEKLNDNWYFGRNKRGCEGIFPSNYVDIKIPLNVENNSVPLKQTVTNYKENGKAKSLYKFVAEVEDDLALNENDIVTVLYKINDVWLYGELNGKRGQFPANFVEFI